MSKSCGQRERVEPLPPQLALLADIAETLQSIKEYEEEERSRGIVEPYETLTVTDERRTLIARGGKWQSLTIINDGPDSVWVLVNPGLSNDPHRIDDGEVHVVDFHRPRIGEVVLWCEAGHRTSLRVVGLK